MTTITDAEKADLADKVKKGSPLTPVHMATVWTLIGAWKPGTEILPGLDQAQIDTLLGRANKALEWSLAKLDAAKTADSARDPGQVACVQAAAAALDLRLSGSETGAATPQLMEAAKLPLLAPITGWLKSLAGGSSPSNASPDSPPPAGMTEAERLAEQQRRSKAEAHAPAGMADAESVAERQRQRDAADAANHARKFTPEEVAADAAAASHTKQAAPAAAPAADSDGDTIAAKWVFVDKSAIIKGADVLAHDSDDRDPFPILVGANFLLPYILEANKQLGVKHPALADYGHGKALASTLALEDLRKIRGFILLLDSRDPVQLQLLHDGMPFFDVVL